MIRHYTPEDQAALLRLIILNTPMYFTAAELKDYEAYLSHEIEDYFVFEQAGSVIGAGGINYFNDQRMARLSWDVVHPDHQKKGVGSQITRHRLNHIRKNPAVDTVMVRTSQLVFKFYEKFGFVLANTSKDYWGKGFDLYEMKLG